MDAVDRVYEDINRNENSRATGYIGKGSDITWMQRLQQEAEERTQGQFGTSASRKNHSPVHQPSSHALNYHLDDLDIGTTEPVQIYWTPPRALADQLMETYMQMVHPHFPIINRPNFVVQYNKSFDEASFPGDKWLAILNMIFAIAIQYAHSTKMTYLGDPQNPLSYLTRARMLCMNGDDVFRHPDLQQVQVEGLMAFYLLSSDQINRSASSK